LHEKTLSKKKNKEKYKFLGVVAFFLVCGAVYSHSFYNGEIHMGTAISTDDFGKPAGISAEMEKINLNKASVEELIRLSGIGEKRAEDIIAYRDENGEFTHITDIMKVSGIGEKMYEEIKEQITVEE